jgi:hypothetical protein
MLLKLNLLGGRVDLCGMELGITVCLVSKLDIDRNCVMLQAAAVDFQTVGGEAAAARDKIGLTSAVPGSPPPIISDERITSTRNNPNHFTKPRNDSTNCYCTRATSLQLLYIQESHRERLKMDYQVCLSN